MRSQGPGAGSSHQRGFDRPGGTSSSDDNVTSVTVSDPSTATSTASRARWPRLGNDDGLVQLLAEDHDLILLDDDPHDGCPT